MGQENKKTLEQKSKKAKKQENKLTVFLFFCFFAFLTLDRFFKFLAVNNYLSEGVNIIGDFFQLNFTPNPNIAFSLPLSGTWLNILIILIILSLIAHFTQAIRKNNFRYISYLVLIIIGAISNLYDRLKYGFVIDYFDLKHFTVFNLADALIFLGVVFLMINIKRQFDQDLLD